MYVGVFLFLKEDCLTVGLHMKHAASQMDFFEKCLDTGPLKPLRFIKAATATTLRHLPCAARH